MHVEKKRKYAHHGLTLYFDGMFPAVGRTVLPLPVSVSVRKSRDYLLCARACGPTDGRTVGWIDGCMVGWTAR